MNTVCFEMFRAEMVAEDGTSAAFPKGALLEEEVNFLMRAVLGCCLNIYILTIEQLNTCYLVLSSMLL